jgi:Family of unknown function (DUF6994)
MVVWPGNQIDGKWTINRARGCTGRIADRFDLTVECVRRHYEGDTTHPLADAFGRYRDFLDLFGSFAGYVDFWLLDDLVDTDGGVKLFLPRRTSPGRRSLGASPTTSPSANAPSSSSRLGTSEFANSHSEGAYAAPGACRPGPAFWDPEWSRS